jgi:hypothetical protein
MIWVEMAEPESVYVAEFQTGLCQAPKGARAAIQEQEMTAATHGNARRPSARMRNARSRTEHTDFEDGRCCRHGAIPPIRSLRPSRRA